MTRSAGMTVFARSHDILRPTDKFFAPIRLA